MTLLHLISHVHKEHVIQYTLVLLDDVINQVKERVRTIHETVTKHKFNIWPPFMSLLNRDDPIIMHMGSRLIAKLATYSRMRCPDSDLIYYLNWLKVQLCVPVSSFVLQNMIGIVDMRYIVNCKALLHAFSSSCVLPFMETAHCRAKPSLSNISIRKASLSEIIFIFLPRFQVIRKNNCLSFSTTIYEIKTEIVSF